MEDRSDVIVSESETEEETVFAQIDIEYAGYAALSPCCEVTSASTKVSLQRSSFNYELVLESDPEDTEDESSSDLHVIVMGPAPCVPFMETLYSVGSKSFKLTTHFLRQDVHCSKRLFEAVKFSDNVKEPIAKIELVIVRHWNGCEMTSVLFGTDNFNYYHCPFPDCNKKLRKKYNMTAHLATSHHGPFYCPKADCGKCFSSKVSKLRHVRKTAHDGHCLSPPTVSYHSRQIKNFCLSLCKKIEMSPGFWMI